MSHIFVIEKLKWSEMVNFWAVFSENELDLMPFFFLLKFREYFFLLVSTILMGGNQTPPLVLLVLKGAHQARISIIKIKRMI